jgi:hypothetical protein
MYEAGSMMAAEDDFFSPIQGPEELGDDVCPRGKPGKLAVFRKWLYEEDTQIRYRFAPSIILRSEAELFGVSSPRFAVRCYLTEKSFVNGRRRDQLATEIMLCHGTERTTDVRERLKKEPWIADSVLEPPKDLLNAGFRFLTVDLSAAYGEPLPFQGVPFVNHIRHGGGMCAQAACFMALSMMHDRVRPLGGMADITLLASASGHFSPGGLSATDIESLFQKKIQGTNAVLQLAFVTPTTQRRIVSDVAMALKGYLASDCPVIGFVSLSRMFGNHQLHGENPSPILTGTKGDVDPNDSTYRRRRFIPVSGVHPKQPAEVRAMNHAVVLVGWRDTGKKDEFVINDPATFPFIPLTDEQLIDARQYRSNVVGRSLKATDVQEYWQCLPITPKEVIVPLLDRRVAGSDKSRLQQDPGLITLARIVQGWAGSASPCDLKYDLDRGEPQFRLIDLRKEESEWQRLELNCDDGIPACVRRLVPDIYWAQYLDWEDGNGRTRCSVWLWYASQPLNRKSPQTGVAAVLAQKSLAGPWQLIYSAVEGEIADES